MESRSCGCSWPTSFFRIQKMPSDSVSHLFRCNTTVLVKQLTTLTWHRPLLIPARQGSGRVYFEDPGGLLYPCSYPFVIRIWPFRVPRKAFPLSRARSTQRGRHVSVFLAKADFLVSKISMFSFQNENHIKTFASESSK